MKRSARNQRARDVLFERGRSWRADGAEIRHYAGSGDRIVARVGVDRVELARKVGVVCPGLAVTLAELQPLVAFLRWWHRHRSRWAAFYWSGAGYPPGFGSAAYYQPRGGAPRLRVATRLMGKLDGEDFTGADVRERAIASRPVAGAAGLEARVIRRGERFGDPAGEPVGALYRCGRLRLEANRNSVTVRRGKQWVQLEPQDGVFLERLIAVTEAERKG
jgi:hypothetical protein